MTHRPSPNIILIIKQQIIISPIEGRINKIGPILCSVIFCPQIGRRNSINRFLKYTYSSSSLIEGHLQAAEEKKTEFVRTILQYICTCIAAKAPKWTEIVIKV